MMVLMWAAEWPLAKFTSAAEPTMSTNPIVDYHIIYALALIALALTYAGHTWGLGRLWPGCRSCSATAGSSDRTGGQRSVATSSGLVATGAPRGPV